jgi:ankyrin repeat protein
MNDLGDDTFWWTPLQRAAFQRESGSIKTLLRLGAPVDGPHDGTATPLMWAALRDHAAALALFLQSGAHVNHVTVPEGETVLHWAARSVSLDAMRTLLDAGARVDVRCRAGKLPSDVVGLHVYDHPNKRAMGALLAAHTPWSRRRPLALACYTDARVWGVNV